MTDYPTLRNNSWFRYNDSDSVLVFVHGILSGSETAWLYEAKKTRTQVFWPELVAGDKRFRNASIFLAGYDTSVDSGPRGFRDCADQVLNGLRLTDTDEHAPVIAKQKITFICHSLGGIVVRYLLESKYQEFVGKRLGLVLIASPSFGSKLPNDFRTLSLLIQSYRNRLAEQLRWGGEAISDLDDRFKELVDKKRLPNLYGVEFCENWFIVHRKWIPMFTKKLVVPKESAARYFGAGKYIPQSDHSSICKPKSIDDTVHKYLLEFLLERDLLPTPAATVSPELIKPERAESEGAENALRAFEGQPQLTPAAITKAHSALRETISYQARLRHGGDRSESTENRLSELWFAAAGEIQPHDPELAKYCWIKGYTWADEDFWNQPEIRGLPIRINDMLGRLIGVQLHSGDSQTESAVRHYENALAALHSGGHHQLVIAQLDRAISLDPGMADAYAERARARQAISDYRDAVEDWSRVLELKPFQISARFNRALAYRSLGEFDKAEEDLSKVVASSSPRELRGTAQSELDLLINIRNSADVIDGFVRRKLDVPRGDLTDLELAAIEDLDLSNALITDLIRLATLPNLKSLQLSGCSEVAGVGPLASLRKLAFLSLRHCGRISDLTPLAQLPLQGVSLEGCAAVTDISPLARLRTLESLDLSGTSVSNLDPVARLDKLRWLSIKDCRDIKSIAALDHLADLRELYAQNTGIQDLSPLNYLFKLESLDLGDCRQISALEPLARLRRLKYLRLARCHQVSNLAPLAGADNLEILDVSECPAAAAIPEQLLTNNKLHIFGKI